MRLRTLLKRALALAALALLAAAAWLYFAPKPAIKVDEQMRIELVDNLARQLAEHYVYPEKGAKMGDLIRARQGSGAYAGLTDGDQLAAAISADLQSVVRDLHMRVRASSRQVPTSLGMQGLTGAPRQPAEPFILVRWIDAAGRGFSSFGVDQVALLDGGVGYLKLSAFAQPERAAPRLAAAFTRLAESSSLIIDLRDNDGGDPGGVALLASYFFDKPTHLNDIWWRDSNSTASYWTRDQVDGPRYGAGKRVFILTSRRTPSAAEQFAYDMQQLQRATIVGEPTWGGAHPARAYFAGRHFIATIPSARAINPISKSNWEATGVLPDFAVPPEQALDYVVREWKNKHLVLN